MSDPPAQASHHLPPGPWVLVVGMHRSGTSAVAGALGALGLNLPRLEDRVEWTESNPEHFESYSLSRYNETLLELFGGSWNAPPELATDSDRWPEQGLAPDPAPIAAAAFPDPGPLVWKDPRICLLLPHWRPLIPAPLAAVLVWRDPVAVARSLQRRDDLFLSDGLALWEHYNSAAIDGLDGLDVYVVNYQAMVDRPRGTIETLATWLASLDQFIPYAAAWDIDRAVSVITAGLQHQHDAADNDMLLAEHRRMVDSLSALDGGHRGFRSKAFEESEWTRRVLEGRRDRLQLTRQIGVLENDLWVKRGELAVAGGYLEAFRKEIEDLRTSTSWRVTKPLRSLLAMKPFHSLLAMTQTVRERQTGSTTNRPPVP